MFGEFVGCAIELQPTETEGGYCMFGGSCACETSMESSVSCSSDCGGGAPLEGFASIEVDGKSHVESISNVVVVGTMPPLGTSDMPLVVGAKGPDNSRSKRSKGFDIVASGFGSVVEDLMVMLGVSSTGTIAVLETSNEAQLFSLSCVILGVSCTGTIAVSEAWDLILESLKLLDLLLFCSDGFSSTEPSPPEVVTFYNIHQRFSLNLWSTDIDTDIEHNTNTHTSTLVVI